MANKDININDSNLYEWLCSTGYLLPSNEVELARFERLFPSAELLVNENAIDPFAIINGRRQRNRIIQATGDSNFTGEVDQLRMAARKHQPLPDHIVDKIKRNQSKDNGESDNPES